MIIIMFISSMMIYFRVEDGRKSTERGLKYANESSRAINQLVQKQLPLLKNAAIHHILARNFKYEIELFVLEERGDISAVDQAFGELQDHFEIFKNSWIEELPIELLSRLQGNIGIMIGIVEELHEYNSVGFGEMHILLEESKSFIAELISITEQISYDLDRNAQETNRKVLESSYKTSSNFKKLSRLFDLLVNQSFVSLSIFILTALISQLIFIVILKRKLGDLVQITSRITQQKKLSERVDINSSDEIGILAGSFNDMLDELESIHEEITSTNEFLDNILQSMVELLIVINPDTTIEIINQTAVDLLGYQKEELIGKPITILIAEEDEEWKREFHELEITQLVKKSSNREIERNLLAKDGRLISVQFSSSAIYDKEVNIQGIVCIARDITLLKLAEKETLKLEEQLRQTQKMESLGTLAGGIAHDFNTLIGTIIGYSEIISNETSKDSNIQDYLSSITKVANRAKILVKQIRDFSRQKTIDKVPVNIIQSIRSSLDFIKTILPSTIDIQAEFEIDELLITANEDQIYQIFLNLCSNSADFMKGSHQIITVKTEVANNNNDELNRFLNIRPGSFLKLSVSDTGSGITPEHIDRIFDPYFTTKDIGKGSGLGLSIVYSIVKNHNGYIFVESKKGKGTTFIIFLPSTENSNSQVT